MLKLQKSRVCNRRNAEEYRELCPRRRGDDTCSLIGRTCLKFAGRCFRKLFLILLFAVRVFEEIKKLKLQYKMDKSRNFNSSKKLVCGLVLWGVWTGFALNVFLYRSNKNIKWKIGSSLHAAGLNLFEKPLPAELVTCCLHDLLPHQLTSRWSMQVNFNSWFSLSCRAASRLVQENIHPEWKQFLLLPTDLLQSVDFAD